MELTVMNKKRYDELMKRISELETQTALAHSQLRAIQDSNNQLAEIAFDEARFTDVVLDKVDELDRDAARDAVDVEDIAREAYEMMDIREEVNRQLERMDFQTGDDVNDRIRDIINNEDLVSEGQVEDLISDYVENNCDFVEKDVTDTLHDEIQDLKHELRTLKDDIVLEVLQLIANKLTGKETHHANNNRGDGLYISGTLTKGEATGDADTRA